MRNYLILTFVSLILSACAITKSPAPIVYNHKNSKLHSSQSKDYDVIVPTIDQNGNTEIIDSNDSEKNYNDEQNYVLPEENPVTASRKIVYHEVQPGESIDDIALAYGQSAEEIARLNSLLPPYAVEPYQSLEISVDSSFSGPKSKVKPVMIQEASFINPVEGKILSPFGSSTVYGVNKGLNIAAKAGTKVVASASGKVIYSDYDSTFGNLVMIKVANENTVTAYAHLEDLIVNKGSMVKQGDIIGYVGSTGKVKESQLHFAIREGKKSIDPQKYVKY